MSTSPQAGGQRVIYVHLDQEPEVTQEVRVRVVSACEPQLNHEIHTGIRHRFASRSILLKFSVNDLLSSSIRIPLLRYFT